MWGLLYFHYMNNIHLNGRWGGQYIYGPIYGPELEGVKEEFVLYILELNENSFKGKVIDANRNGEFIEASLEGFLEDNFMSFVKRYSKFRAIDDDNNVIEEEGDGYEVIYEGSYNKETQQFNG